MTDPQEQPESEELRIDTEEVRDLDLAEDDVDVLRGGRLSGSDPDEGCQIRAR
jgi:hypothetical protein